jgi:hypothetical protein
MGIRFLCPNGHKLNVKTELAGKRAICPDCGAKLVVPAVSMSPSESSLLNIQAASGPAIVAAAPIAPAASFTAAATEQPVVWYVRPASGGQFGPLSAAELTAWIADQRVMADTYLWRPGWTDWRMASDTPPDLPSPLPSSTIVTAPLADAPTPTVPIAPPASEFPAAAPHLTTQDPDSLALNPEPQPLSTPALAKPVAAIATPVPAVASELPVMPGTVVRRRRQQTPIIVTILLVFTIFLLVGALIWVIRRNGGSAPAGPQTERIPIAAATERS